MTLGDRIAVMRGGAIEQLGAPRTVYEDPATRFVASFLGSPQCNLIDLERKGDRLVHAGGLDLPLLEGFRDCDRLTVGLRPEHLRLGDSVRGDVEIRATVVVAEPLGAETHLTVESGGVRLRARVEGFMTPARGEPVRLSIAPSRLLYFDGATGARIRSLPRGEASA